MRTEQTCLLGEHSGHVVRPLSANMKHGPAVGRLIRKGAAPPRSPNNRAPPPDIKRRTAGSQCSHRCHRLEPVVVIRSSQLTLTPILRNLHAQFRTQFCEAGVEASETTQCWVLHDDFTHSHVCRGGSAGLEGKLEAPALAWRRLGGSVRRARLSRDCHMQLSSIVLLGLAVALLGQFGARRFVVAYRNSITR